MEFENSLFFAPLVVKVFCSDRISRVLSAFIRVHLRFPVAYPNPTTDFFNAAR